MLGTVALVGAATTVIIYISIPTSLRIFFISSSYGAATIYAGMLSVVLSRLGIVQGWFRGRLTRLINQIPFAETDVSMSQAVERFHKLENRMRLIVLPETMLILIILGLMVYVANPFRII
jgi:hypothetical protein